LLPAALVPSLVVLAQECTETFQCSSSQVCLGGVCEECDAPAVPCDAGSNCSSGEYCAGTCQTCQRCEVPTDFRSHASGCIASQAVIHGCCQGIPCSSDADCEVLGLACNAGHCDVAGKNSSFMEPSIALGGCTGDADCGAGLFCKEDVCVPMPCDADVNCPTGMHCAAASSLVAYSSCSWHPELHQVEPTVLIVNSDCPDASLGCLGGCFQAPRRLLPNCLFGGPAPSVVADILMPRAKQVWIEGKTCESLGFDQQDPDSINGDPCYGGSKSLIRFFSNYDWQTFANLTGDRFCPPRDCDAWVAAHSECCDGPCELYPDRPGVQCDSVTLLV